MKIPKNSPRDTGRTYDSTYDSPTDTNRSNRPMTVKKRKHTVSTELGLKIVQDYMETDLTTTQLAEKYSTTEKNIELIVSRHWKALTNVRETRNLIGNQMSSLNHKGGNYLALKAINKVPSINQDFLDLLSAPEDKLLTDNELQYAMVFCATGDNYHAIHEAQLDVGLMGSKGDKQRHQYELAVKLRGVYLRRKENVAKYIMQLKEETFLPDVVDHNLIKAELLEQLAQQKESGTAARRDILNTIHMLGKTVGAFSDVVKVQEVDPGKALDYLESLAQADAELVSSEDTTED